jgi:GNAT superfamily N-acetyltransferase
MSLLIRNIIKEDTESLVRAFADHNWDKPTSLFENYLTEVAVGARAAWIAFVEEKVAGYVTLKWESSYQPFGAKLIPEIMDLNVLPPFRNRGIGSKLLEIAEKEVSKKGDIIGLGVGLYDGYGSAQKLYIKRGYIPDGLGITYNGKRVGYGEKVELDDDLILWFTKLVKVL